MKPSYRKLKESPEKYRSTTLTTLVGLFLARLGEYASPEELEIAVIKSRRGLRLGMYDDYLDAYVSAETVMEMCLESLFSDLPTEDFDMSDRILSGLAIDARSIAMDALYSTFPEEFPA